MNQSLKIRMSARSPDEEHRAATMLELFFDLVFVVAVAFAASELHHGIAENHIRDTVISYMMVFFAIWWAWVNFTWFASAFDTDDVPYRIAVFVQMVGVLILAAGIPEAFDEQTFTIATFGYVVMRLALVSLWLRAAHSDPEHRPAALRIAIGISVLQVGWALLLLAPESLGLVGFLVLVAAEILLPIWAQRASPAPYHPEHIAERYSLFTIIVLGESILAASLAVQSVIDTGDVLDHLQIIVGGLLIVFTMWWLYFERPSHDLLTTQMRGFLWGYGHYFILGSAAAVGAGLAVAVDHATDHTEIGSFVAGSAVTVPVAIYITGVWLLHDLHRVNSPLMRSLSPITAVLILMTPLTESPILLTGLLLVVLLTTKIVANQASENDEPIRKY